MTPAEQAKIVEILKSLVTTMGKLIQILSRPGTNANERTGLSSRLLTGFPSTSDGAVSNSGTNTKQIAVLLSAAAGTVTGGAITGASSKAIATVVGVAGYVDYSAEIQQYLFADNDAGQPSTRLFNDRMRMSWRRFYSTSDSRRRQGNWIDSAGVQEGATPFHGTQNFTGNADAIGTVWSVNVLGVIQKQTSAPFQNKGIRLKSIQNWYVNFHGRLASNVSQRPRLVVQTEVGGPQTLAAIANCYFSFASDLAVSGGTTEKFQSSVDAIAYIQFPLQNIVGATVSSAVMELTVQGLDTAATRTHGLQVFEADPPLFLVAGSIPGTPVQGHAQNFQYDKDMFGSHADVTYARDYTGSVNGSSLPWRGTITTPNTTRNRIAAPSQTDSFSGPTLIGGTWYAEFIYNSETGTTYRKGHASDDGGLFNTPEAVTGNQSSNYNLPPRTVGTPSIWHANLRYYMKVEHPWQCDNVGELATKWFGFDNRWGWWNAAGYWQHDGGNSGVRNLGKVEVKSGKLGMYGNSQRGHLGRERLSYEQSSDPHPYDRLLYFGTYFYHVDLAEGQYGNGLTWGYTNRLEHYPDSTMVSTVDVGPHVGVVYNVNTAKWVCVELEMQVNTVDGPYDEYNNGTGVRDGNLKVYVDGILVAHMDNFRITQNKDYGIQAGWLSCFYGGPNPPWYGAWPARYGVDTLAMTKGGLYIGPRAETVLPEWSVGMVTDEFRNISSYITQNFTSIVSPWNSFYSTKIDEFSGGVYNPYWGPLGAMVLHGGGHSSSNDNSVYLLDFNDMKYKRVSQHSHGVMATLTGDVGGGTAAIGDQTSHDVDEFGYFKDANDGAPAAAHTYDNQVILPPAGGGATYGSLIRQPNQSVGVKPSRMLGYAHTFGFESLTQTTGTWTRGNNTSTNVVAGGAAAYDPVRNRVWWLANPSSGSTFTTMRWFDVATQNNASISLTGSSFGNIQPDGMTLRYDQTSDRLILFGASPGTVTSQNAYSLSCDNPAAGWTQAAFSQVIPSTGGQFAFDLCTDTGKWYGITSANKSQVYEVIIPASGTWTVTPRSVSGSTNWVGDMYVMGKYWSYMPAIKRFVWQADVRTPGNGGDIVYVYKPPGV